MVSRKVLIYNLPNIKSVQEQAMWLGCVGVCIVSPSVGRVRKRWIDTEKDGDKYFWVSGKQGEGCMKGVNGGGIHGA